MPLYICSFSLCKICSVRYVIQKKLLESFIVKLSIYRFVNILGVGERIGFVYTYVITSCM